MWIAPIRRLKEFYNLVFSSHFSSLLPQVSRRIDEALPNLPQHLRILLPLVASGVHRHIIVLSGIQTYVSILDF
jgi:hypothetical protein